MTEQEEVDESSNEPITKEEEEIYDFIPEIEVKKVINGVIPIRIKKLSINVG